MKKLILILSSILLLIYMFLFLLSFHGEYSAQRELWGINQSLGFIASHQESIPDYAINQLANRYRTFIRKYKGSIYAQRAQLMIGNLYALRKDYAQARLEYQKASGPDEELSVQAQLAIAKTYELEGQWDKADETYADTVVFYKNIAIKNPKSKLEYNALRVIAICQLNQKDFSGTVKTMEEIIMKYPTGKALEEAINTINLLCVTKLHDYDMAINIYQKFIEKYPSHSVDGLLKKMIKYLQLLKDKKLIIQVSSVKKID